MFEGGSKEIVTKGSVTTSLDSSLEKFYYEEKLKNVAEFGEGRNVKGGLF